MTECHPDISIVLPVYNESAILEETVTRTVDTLNGFLDISEYEIIIAENGSTDTTPQIADQLAEKYPQVRVVVKQKAGRGGALNEAFRQSKGQTVGYFDADLATDMGHLEELVESVRTEGYDLATGSRYMPESDVSRPPERKIPSKGFNFMTRKLLGSSVADHQCGFKMFDRDVILEIIPDIKDDHWFWDTEVLVRAQRRGYSIKEFAVEWEPKEDSKVDLVQDILGMGNQILGRWWEFNVAPKVTRQRTMLIGSLLIFLVIAISPYYLDIGLLFEQLASVDPLYLVIASLVYTLSLPIRGVRYKQILASLGEQISVVTSTGSIFISQTANLVIPARSGDAMRAFVIKTKQGTAYPTGFASLFIERLLDLLTVIGLAVVGVLSLVVVDPAIYTQLQTRLFAGETQAGRTGVIVAAAVALMVLLIGAVIIYTARQDESYLSRLQDQVRADSYLHDTFDHLKQFSSGVQVMARKPGTFASALVLSLAIWAIDIGTAVVVFRSFGITDINLVLVLVTTVAVSIGNLSKVLPLTPGGVGLYEGVFTAFVLAVTPFSWSVVLGIALVDHVIKNVVTTIGGFVSITAFNISLSQAAEVSEEAQAQSTATTFDE